MLTFATLIKKSTTMQDYKNPNLLIPNSDFEQGKVLWRSPSNLAIVKYWGKYGVQLPRNPSISFTLENAFTETVLEYSPRTSGKEGVQLDFLFHGEMNEPFRLKMVKFLESITDIFPFLNQVDLRIQSANSFPHSAGIASSASSMSALALCLCSMEDEIFDSLGDDDAFEKKASFVARLGSGSACRSIFGTMGLWGKIEGVLGSSNLYALPYADEVHDVFKTFHDDILIASKAEKSVSSRAGHALMEGNDYAVPRYRQANQRMKDLLGALQTGDVEKFGTIAENEALTLHALMMTCEPSYLLMRPNTLKMMEILRNYRQETGFPVYFSLDAGPNLHVLYPEDMVHEIRPFIENELVPFCEDEMWIPDWVGNGPVQI